MKEWLNNGNPNEVLNLSRLGLISLPRNLPAGLVNLSVASNELTSLPENLPASLKHLNAYANRLTSLPENLPAALEHLNASDNRLTSLPANLPAPLINLNVAFNHLTNLPQRFPDSLRHLNVGRNLLTWLPENLPASLVSLLVANNQLTSLPENITARLTRNCFVNLENNPLSQRVLNHLNGAVSVAGYQGPRFEFSMAAGANNAPVRPLVDAVADWHEEGAKEAAANTWGSFVNEDGAAAFSQFLDRLRGTVNYGNPAFRKSVIAWLSHLVGDAQLRAATFDVSVGATASCEDRVSLTFNNMKTVRLAADVESGLYDESLPELIGVARVMFRLDQLAEIARLKVASLRMVDEIEVYLALQVKLREPLKLSLDTADMRFFNMSYVTKADLINAEKKVKQSENKEFFSYLAAEWAPWQAVMKRRDASGFESTQSALMTAMEKDFPRRLQERLAESGLQNDDDAQRIVGPEVKDEIARELRKTLTMRFLTRHQLAHLLEPPWE